MRVEDLTRFEGECPNIVVFGTYMDIRVPLTKKRIIRSGMRQKGKDVFESPDGLYIEMVYENKAFVPYRPIKEIQDLPIDAKYIPLLTRIFGKNILAEIGGDKIFITTGKYAVNFWCWKK